VAPGHLRTDHALPRTRRLIDTVARGALPLLVLTACVVPFAPAAPARGVVAEPPLDESSDASSPVAVAAIEDVSEAPPPVAVAATGEQVSPSESYVPEAEPTQPARDLEVRLQGGGRATIDAIEDGQLVRSMAAFAGGEAAPTPTGTFAVQAHVESLTTTMWAATSGHEWMLPYFVQVDGDVGIHGPKIDLRSGRPVPGPSSGCLSPSLADSVWLYDWAVPGTPVHITRI
jgi:lipoprotein-anchoring transpeptidase ErfK/SrfK